jgi:FkbH-like protein
LRLRQSRFLHLIPLEGGRVLAVHALSQLKLTLDAQAAAMVEYFAQARDLPEEFPGLAARVGLDADAIVLALQGFTERDILTQKTPDEELAALSATFGRDPEAMLERFRLQAREGGESYWAVGRARGLAELGGQTRRLDVILMGDCDIQMEAEFLQAEALERGVDLRVAATFPDDLRLLAERPHDAVMIGALRSRRAIAEAPQGDRPPFAPFVAEARQLLAAVRQHTTAPVLIDNLPEPTVQPLGLAEHGANGHRNRFRLANVSLAQTVEAVDGAYVVDVAAALAQAGSAALVDDAQVDFTHFGAPGWMLQRPQSEKAAVHDLFPDIEPLAALVGGDPYGREKLMARAHLDVLTTVLAIDQKKCVILDLDGVMWPGVLAETGSPFAWAPDVSSPFSYVGLYFGLHEALLCLKRRGVLLACVSKNDQDLVERLWTYPEHYPRERLVTPADFVTWRVNWNDKVDNIRSIAEELGFALETFLFIDDHPVERDRVRQRLPEVEVWGEDPFALRRRLLTDPRLQRPRVTQEAANRTQLVKAQLARQQALAATVSESDYLESLNLEHRLGRLEPGDPLMDRVQELFQRTTQFNTTGRKFSAGELEAHAGEGGVFALHVRDRFGDHGLVGAAVIDGGEIVGLALSCRVLGMGVERRFLRDLLAALEPAEVRGRVIDTDRNIPVRNVYRDNGFVAEGDGVWRFRAGG